MFLPCQHRSGRVRQAIGPMVNTRLTRKFYGFLPPLTKGTPTFCTPRRNGDAEMGTPRFCRQRRFVGCPLFVGFCWVSPFCQLGRRMAPHRACSVETRIDHERLTSWDARTGSASWVAGKASLRCSNTLRARRARKLLLFALNLVGKVLDPRLQLFQFGCLRASKSGQLILVIG